MKLIVAKLIRFDRDKLPFYKLIYYKFKLPWIILSIVLILIGFFFFGFFLIPLNLNNWWALAISIPFLTLSIIYVRQKTLQVIIDNYNKEYNLNISDKWDYDTIQILRLKMFLKKRKSIGIRDIDQLHDILKYLEFDLNTKKYSYNFSITFIVLILGALISGFVAGLIDKTETLQDFYHINKLILSIAIMILITFYFLDKYLLKEIILMLRNRNKRLIQLIYNYLIEIKK